jgi:LmbE family N-acetylglucosaminyl deacetylase
MRKVLPLLIALFSCYNVPAQQFRPSSSSAIYQQLQQLNVLGTVMYVAAHPDDENTRLISYLVHHDHVRTIYLSLTRGDGGQNILGNEQGSTLGLIRTHELIEARKIDGAEQLFTHVIDFGYTKSPEETFKFWDRKQLVEDVKKAFQQYRPDVVICRFPTTGEGGHGQHTVSAIIAEETFKAIEQVKASESGHTEKSLWLPTRLLFNSFRFGDRNTTSEDQFKIPINQYDPLLGEGYGEMAGRSRSIHKSQGAGTPQSVGLSNEYFKFLAGKPIRTSLYDDIDISWGRVGHKEIGTHIQQVISNFNFTDPSKNIPALVAIMREIETIEDTYWKTQKLAEINNIIVSCAGIMAEALTGSPEATPGSEIPVSLNLVARSSVPVKVEGIGFNSLVNKDDTRLVSLLPDSLYKFSYSIRLNENEPLTEPYWLQYSATTGAYQYDSLYAGLPEAKNRLSALVSVSIEGKKFFCNVPVSYKKLDPVRGDVVERLRIVPAISVEPLHSLLVYEQGKDKEAWLRLKAFKAISKAVVQVKTGGKVIRSLTINSLEKGQDTLFYINLPTQMLNGTDDNSYVTFSVQAEGNEYNRDQHLIQYPHLPELQYFTGAWMKAIRKDWKVAVKKVGYIEGAGDYVDGILNLCGLDVERVPANAMSSVKYLSNYEAIIIGIRAFNTQQKIAAWMPVLMQYVQNGGTLIVQYNTNQNLVTQHFSPYPITISRDRVTEEDAKVTFTNPDSRLLHFPNNITPADFNNWVQERGVYYPGQWDEHYQTLVAMHDTGEKELQSGILYTPYGKGQFIYTSLAFFRQLPAGNTGAIKLMMNLLSAGKQ